MGRGQPHFVSRCLCCFIDIICQHSYRTSNQSHTPNWLRPRAGPTKGEHNAESSFRIGRSSEYTTSQNLENSSGSEQFFSSDDFLTSSKYRSNSDSPSGPGRWSSQGRSSTGRWRSKCYHFLLRLFFSKKNFGTFTCFHFYILLIIVYLFFFSFFFLLFLSSLLEYSTVLYCTVLYSISLSQHSNFIITSFCEVVLLSTFPSPPAGPNTAEDPTSLK